MVHRHKLILCGLALFPLAFTSASFAETASPTPAPSPLQERGHTPTAADFERLNNQNRSRTQSGDGMGSGQHSTTRGSTHASGSGQQRRYGGGR